MSMTVVTEGEALVMTVERLVYDFYDTVLFNACDVS